MLPLITACPFGNHHHRTNPKLGILVPEDNEAGQRVLVYIQVLHIFLLACHPIWLYCRVWFFFAVCSPGSLQRRLAAVSVCTIVEWHHTAVRWSVGGHGPTDRQHDVAIRIRKRRQRGQNHQPPPTVFVQLPNTKGIEPIKRCDTAINKANMYLWFYLKIEYDNL